MATIHANDKNVTKVYFPLVKLDNPSSIQKLLIKATNRYVRGEIDKEQASTIKAMCESVLRSLPYCKSEERLQELEQLVRGGDL